MDDQQLFETGRQLIALNSDWKDDELGALFVPVPLHVNHSSFDDDDPLVAAIDDDQNSLKDVFERDLRLELDAYYESIGSSMSEPTSPKRLPQILLPGMLTDFKDNDFSKSLVSRAKKMPLPDPLLWFQPSEITSSSMDLTDDINELDHFATLSLIELSTNDEIDEDINLIDDSLLQILEEPTLHTEFPEFNMPTFRRAKSPPSMFDIPGDEDQRVDDLDKEIEVFESQMSDILQSQEFDILTAAELLEEPLMHDLAINRPTLTEQLKEKQKLPHDVEEQDLHALTAVCELSDDGVAELERACLLGDQLWPLPKVEPLKLPPSKRLKLDNTIRELGASRPDMAALETRLTWKPYSANSNSTEALADINELDAIEIDLLKREPASDVAFQESPLKVNKSLAQRTQSPTKTLPAKKPLSEINFDFGLHNWMALTKGIHLERLSQSRKRSPDTKRSESLLPSYPNASYTLPKVPSKLASLKIIVSEQLFQDQLLVIELKQRYQVECVIRRLSGKVDAIVGADSALFVYDIALLSQANDVDSINDYIDTLRDNAGESFPCIYLVFELYRRSSDGSEAALDPFTAPICNSLYQLNRAYPFIRILFSKGVEHTAQLIRNLLDSDPTNTGSAEWISETCSHEEQILSSFHGFNPLLAARMLKQGTIKQIFNMSHPQLQTHFASDIPPALLVQL